MSIYRNFFLYTPQLNPTHIDPMKTYIGRIDLLTRVFINVFVMSHDIRTTSKLFIYTKFKDKGLILELNEKFIVFLKKKICMGVINERIIAEPLKKIFDHFLKNGEMPKSLSRCKQDRHKMKPIEGYKIYQQKKDIDSSFLKILFPDDNFNVVIRLIEDGKYDENTIKPKFKIVLDKIGKLNTVLLIGGRDDIEEKILNKMKKYINEHKDNNVLYDTRLGKKHYLASQVTFLINFILDDLE